MNCCIQFSTTIVTNFSKLIELKLITIANFKSHIYSIHKLELKVIFVDLFKRIYSLNSF